MDGTTVAQRDILLYCFKAVGDLACWLPPQVPHVDLSYSAFARVSLFERNLSSESWFRLSNLTPCRPRIWYLNPGDQRIWYLNPGKNMVSEPGLGLKILALSTSLFRVSLVSKFSQ